MDRWTQNLPLPTPAPDPNAPPPVPGASPTPVPSSTPSDEDKDDIVYTWTCTDGYFVVDGQQVQEAKGRQVMWNAPPPTPTPPTPAPDPNASPTPVPTPTPDADLPHVTISCKIDDKPKEVVLPDGPNSNARDDAVVERKTTVIIDPNATDDDRSQDPGDDEGSAPAIHLSIDTAEEDTKDTKGGWLIRNGGYEEDNFNSDGYSVEDNQPDENAGDRIDSSDEDLRDGTLDLPKVSGGIWKLTFPNNIKVWVQSSEESYTQIQSGEESVIDVSSSLLNLKIEGINEGNDVTVTATAKYSNLTESDTVNLCVYSSSFLSYTSSPNFEEPSEEVPAEEIPAEEAPDFDVDTSEESSMAGSASTSSMSVDTTGEASTESTTSASSTFTAPIAYHALTRLYPYAPNIRSHIVPTKALSPSVGVDVGDYIRWTIYGNGQISTDGSNWTNTIRQQVPSDGRPPIYFRANSTGFMRLMLTNDKSKPVINYAFTAYTLDALQEVGQPHNRLPALYPEKRVLSESFKRSPAYGERMRNALTLYVSSEPVGEPNSDQLNLLLVTSATRVKGTPIYYWGVVKKVYSASGVSTSLVKKGPLNTNGRAQVFFHPTDSYEEWPDETYMVGIGVDAMGDGIHTNDLVSEHYSSRYTTGPSFEVRAFNHNDYISASNRILHDQIIASNLGLKVAPYFLYLFRNNERSIDAYGSNISYPTANGFADPIASGELSSATQTLPASDPRLTNIAGASFGSTGMASITRYYFNNVWTGAKREDSVGEARIKASKAYAGFKIRKTNKAVNMARASTNHPVGAIRTYSFPCNEDIEFKDSTAGTNPVTKANNDSVNYDLYVATHYAHIAGNISVSLRRNANGWFTRTAFSFIGGVGDLYDFTPLSGSEEKTHNAAVMQSGYRAGSTLRPYGKIYTWYIAIND